MPTLPSGTVTFLFTDIEASTRLLQQLGDRYADVLADYRRLLRATVRERGGQGVDTQGDAFFFAFPRARDALASAVAAQRAIMAHPWPEGGTVRVRMGLHTGEPLSANTGYIGMDIHRAARICASGHGGQILLSDTTCPLIEDGLPPDVRVKDLGEHRLKDLARPQHLFQVVSDDLPADFPPLKSLNVLPNNLPVQLTSFIGREREIAEVKGLLSTTRLLTLTGAGGVGKTRLALQLAAEVLEDFSDGVWQVELATLSDPALVPQAVASALGIPEQPGRSLAEMLTDRLPPKSMLLVVDNCEHLLSAIAHLADALLRGCLDLRILATSREGLGIAGELIYRVPSLSSPDLQRLPSLENLTEYEAIRLFVERATFSQPGFAVTNRTVSAVAQICQRLDGIPLAIEMAAARVKGLSVEQIASRLDDRFRLLTGGSRTALPRHQTLQAAMDWSYNLLPESERVVLRRLSVFAGSFTLEAAEGVCGGEGIGTAEVLDLLLNLVDKSLVVVESRDNGTRYRLLETVHQYGWDRLLEADEAAAVRRRRRDWYLRFAEQAEPELHGAGQEVWLQRLEMEHDNLRAALEWSRTEADGAEAGLRLAAALCRFWYVRGYLTEGRAWLEDVLVRETGGATTSRATALRGAAALADRQGDNARAATLAEESLELCRSLGDRRGIAFSLEQMSSHLVRQGDYARAAVLLEESLALFRELGDKEGISLTLDWLGRIKLHHGDYRSAVAQFKEGLLLLRELGLKEGIAWHLHDLGLAAQYQGDDKRAAALYEEGLVFFKELHLKSGIASSLHRLGLIAVHNQDYGRAAELIRESLTLAWDQREKRSIASALEGLGLVALARGRPESSARLFGAAGGLRAAIGVPLPPVERAHHEIQVSTVRAEMGNDAFEAALAEGRAMTLEQAIEYALAAENGRETSSA